MNDNLQPCPFCGSTDISLNEILGKRPDGSHYCQSVCMDCNTAGPETLPHKPDLATRAWNYRVIPLPPETKTDSPGN